MSLLKSPGNQTPLDLKSRVLDISNHPRKLAFMRVSGVLQDRLGKGTEAECVENIKRAKGAFLNFTWAEGDQVRVAREVFAGLFSHEGSYKSKNQPSDIGEQLVSISLMEAVVYIPDGAGNYLPKAKCFVDFKNPQVNVVKQ